MSSAYQNGDPLATSALESLRAFVIAHRARGADCNFEDFERELRKHVSAFEAELVGEQLRLYDVESQEVRIDGAIYRRKARNEAEYCGVSGSFRVERNTFVPRGGRAVCPMELRAGIVEGHWTPQAARIMAHAVGCAPPREASVFLEELGGMNPSTSSLDRIPKRLSEQWEKRREDFEQELREQEVIPAEATVVAVSIDGVYVPTKAGYEAKKRRVAEGKAQGPAGFREVECGTVSLYDEEGERLETTRYGRAPQRNKATLKEQVKAELESIVKARPDLRVVAMADGARENWEYFSELAKSLEIKTIEIVDFFHVSERLKKALDAYHGENSAESKAAFEEFKVLLMEAEDGVARVVRGLTYRRDRSTGWRRKTIESQLKYFRRYRSRMNYKEFLDEKLPIGTGVIEATCKTLATERLKRSGMSWSIPGIQAVLTIRSLLQSDRWNAGWKLLAEVYRETVEPIDRFSKRPLKMAG